MVITRKFRSDIIGVLVLAAVIHALFCIQVFMALPGGMALTGFGLLLFYPHYMLMFFLPPAYPIHDNGIVDYGELWGKLVVAFPASLVYGIIIVAILAFIRQILSRPKHDA